MSTPSRSPLAPHSASSSPLKRKAMSITQTYYLAHTARGKLASEASRQDHRLLRLVGHANMLDSLMLELSEAEQEQEQWFNQSVKKASKTTTTEEPKHIQWADTIVEEPEEDWQASDAEDSSDSESEYDSEDDIEMESAGVISLQRFQSPKPYQTAHSSREIEEEYEDDGEEDIASLQLLRTPSHAADTPELDHDSDSSDDESMPPSPPSDSVPTFSQKQEIATTSYYTNKTASSTIPASEQQAFFDEGFYLPQRNSPGLISTISVY